MPKVTNITIINETTLRLEQNASIGDEIDLLALNQIDQKLIRQKIDEGKDLIYQAKLEDAKKLFSASEEIKLQELKNSLLNEFSQKEKEYELKIAHLTSSKENLENSLEEKAHHLANEQIRLLEQKINELNATNNKLVLENELKKSQLENQITTLELQKTNLQSDLENKLKLALLEKEKEHRVELEEKEREIFRLKHDRTTHNIKRIGENLEQWCNNEYESYALTGFNNCTWYKDNTIVKEEGDAKGTKADFIFKVYATSELKEEEILTSVACEMKSEDPNSVHKKTNASHFAKLDKDRKKKNCEYALLVSELEMEQPNDLPIRKVVDYEKMYVVRPQYFITFLSIIETLGKKYQSLLLEQKQEAVKFIKTEEILTKFNDFKEELITKSIVKIEKELEVISNQVKAIDIASDKIKDATHNIVIKHLETLKTKIEKFNITKLNKAIDKIEE